MELGSDKLFRISRNEARVIDVAAAYTAHRGLMSACAQYLALRAHSLHGEITLQLRSAEDDHNPLIQEMREIQLQRKTESFEHRKPDSHTPEGLIDRADMSIDGLRYVYGPQMTQTAMDAVSTALHTGYLRHLPPAYLERAQDMLVAYETLRPELTDS